MRELLDTVHAGSDLLHAAELADSISASAEGAAQLARNETIVATLVEVVLPDAKCPGDIQLIRHTLSALLQLCNLRQQHFRLGLAVSERVAAESSALAPWIHHSLKNSSTQDVLQLAMDIIARVAQSEEALLCLEDDVLDAVTAVSRAYAEEWAQPVPNVSANSSFLDQRRAWNKKYPLGAAVSSFMSQLQITYEFKSSTARRAARNSPAAVRLAVWFAMSAKPSFLANLGQGCLLHMVRADAGACLKQVPNLYDTVAAHMVDNSDFAEDDEDEDDEWGEIVKRLEKAANPAARGSSSSRARGAAQSSSSGGRRQGAHPTSGSSSSSSSAQPGGMMQRLTEAAAGCGLGVGGVTPITQESWDRAMSNAMKRLAPEEQQGSAAAPARSRGGMAGSSGSSRAGGESAAAAGAGASGNGGTSSSSKACAVCGNKAGAGGAKLMRCGGCKVVRYCSRGCQVQDWKDGHKDRCKG